MSRTRVAASERRDANAALRRDSVERAPWARALSSGSEQTRTRSQPAVMAFIAASETDQRSLTARMRRSSETTNGGVAMVAQSSCLKSFVITVEDRVAGTVGSRASKRTWAVMTAAT